MSLSINYCSTQGVEMESIDLALCTAPKYLISNANWVDFSYVPRVQFSMLHNELYLFLRYQVEEQEVRAVNTTDHQNVWEDSCVEFFVADETGAYLNFEFNPKGACVAATGAGRANREPLSKELMSQILRLPSPISIDDRGIHHWSLTVAIPLSIIGRRMDRCYNVNMYKCGDKLDIPHFLSYFPIDTPQPDFHRPEFFGQIYLGENKPK